MVDADCPYQIIAPRHLIVPIVSGSNTAQPAFSGSLFMSGAKLYIYTGAAIEKISSA